VAERKCRGLLEAEADVTVVAPSVTPALDELIREGKVSAIRRSWQSGDGDGARLVFAATNNRAVNAAVAREAGQSDIPVCVVDAPEDGTFTSPSVLRRGDLLITVSTGGKSPALAREVRRELETLYGPEYADIVDIAGKLREKALTTGERSVYT